MTIQDAVNKLREYDDAYYNGVSIIEDSVYDAFKSHLFSKLPESHPLKGKVGHEVSTGWKKYTHKIPMGSQNKACTEDEIRLWVDKLYEKIGAKEIDFLVQYKIDGLSLACYYNENVLTNAVTRGDGSIGEDIFANALKFKGVCLSIPVEKEVSVRGEVVLKKINFEKLQGISSTPYKNARNAASGVSRRFDGANARLLDFLAFDINAHVGTEREKTEVLEKLGFSIVPTFVCKNTEQILDIYRKTRDIDREKLPYNIDGLVIKTDRVEYQDTLGIERNRPQHQIAAKFEPEGAVTTLMTIEVQLGRTGKITPVAYLEGVDLDGSTIERASLHNFAYIKDNDIGPGAMVKISKRGEIIPQVEEVLVPGDTYERPTHCHSCQGLLEFDGVNLWCRSKVCPDRDIARIAYWVKTLDMKGFSDKFIKKLYDSGKARSVPELYKLTADDMINLGGIGEKTALKFIETLEKTSLMPMERFLTALGVATLSTETAKDLTERYGTFDKIASASQQDIMNMPGYAETSARAIVDGIAEYRDIAQELLSVVKIKEKASGSLNGMSFCVTGSLRSMSRKEFQDAVEGSGGTYKSSVIQGLGYLVSNEKSGSSKFQKAAKLGVQIIDEDAFLLMLGDRVPVKVEDEPKKETIKLVTETLF